MFVEGGQYVRFEYFEYLIEIEKQRNMRLSSEYLHMTPQALSVCIKNMEQEVGFSILIRKPKGVEFTPEGEKLLACAKRIEKDYRQTLLEIHQEQNEKMEFKEVFFYSTPLVNMYVGSKWIEKVQRKYPQIIFNVLNNTPKKILEEVETKEEQNAIGFLMIPESKMRSQNILQKKFNVQICFKDELFLAAAKNSGFKDKKTISFADLKGKSLIHCTEQEINDIPVQETFYSVKDEINHVRCNSINLWGKMISHDLGLGPIIKCALKQAFLDESISKEKVIGLSMESHPIFYCFCIYSKAAPKYIRQIVQEFQFFY